MHDGLLKKVPKQARAQERLSSILQAAENIALDVGFQAATTSLIASSAGVPVGSFYQYFDDRDSLFEYLYRNAMSDIEKIQAEKATDLIGQVGWQEFIRSMIQTFWENASDHKSFRALTRWHNASRPLFDATATLDSNLGQQITATMDAYGFNFPSDRREAILTTATASLSLGIDLAIEARTDIEADLLIEEAIEMIIHYLTPYAK